MTKTILNTLTALALAATLTVGLAACVQTVKTPKPTATQAAPAPGDVVDESTQLGEGQRAYKMADGTEVVISSDAPVPAEVLADVRGLTSEFDAATLVPSPFGMYSQIVVIKDKLGGTKVVSIVRTVAILAVDAMDPNAKAKTIYAVVVNGVKVKGTAAYDESVALAWADNYIAENGGAEAGWQVLKHY